jgi:hypothetical protein
MSNEINPYAAPPLVAEIVQIGGPWVPGGGLWRDGSQLVILNGAPLPPKCIKTNQPTDQFLKRNLTWYPPWIAFTLLFAWPVFVILALVMQKKSTVYLGLTPQWMRRRRSRVLTTWALVFGGIGLFAVGVVNVNQFETAGGIGMMSGMVMLLSSAIYGVAYARLVVPAKIDDRFTWLKGVCREYLADLPQWPGTR